MTAPKRCPFCQSRGKCTDTRATPQHVRRRYQCTACGTHRWTTVEIAVQKAPRYAVRQEGESK